MTISQGSPHLVQTASGVIGTGGPSLTISAWSQFLGSPFQFRSGITHSRNSPIESAEVPHLRQRYLAIAPASCPAQEVDVELRCVRLRYQPRRAGPVGRDVGLHPVLYRHAHGGR